VITRRLAARACAVSGCAATLIAAVLASGCGVSESVDPVAQAAAVTQSLPGASIRFSGEIISPFSPRPVHFGGDGLLNNDPVAARLRYRFSDLGLSARGGPLSFEVRILRHVFFFHLPLLAARLHGKQWIKFDEGRAARAAGLGSLPSADELDPDQYLTYLRAASGGLTSTGNQVIDGVATSGCRGEFELQRAARLAPRDRRAATIAAVGNLEHITGVHAIPFQVWIDGKHRVRRMSIAEGESSSQAYAVKIFITVDFVRFGEEPRTPAPPSAQTLDVSSAAVRALKAQLRAES